MSTSHNERHSLSSPRLSVIERLALGLVAVATLVALLTQKLPVVLGVAIGGTLAIANFYVLRRLMLGIMHSGHAPRQALLTVLLLLKFGAMGAALYLVLTYVPVSGMAMLLGVSLVVVSIFVEGARQMLRGATTHTESTNR